MTSISYPHWSKATESNRPSRNAFHVQLSARNSSRKTKDRGTERGGEREERGLDRHTSLRVISLLRYISDRVNKRV